MSWGCIELSVALLGSFLADMDQGSCLDPIPGENLGNIASVAEAQITSPITT